MTNSVCRKKIRISDYVLKGLIYASASLSIFLLLGIVGFVFTKGIGAVSLSFLTTDYKHFYIILFFLIKIFYLDKVGLFNIF